MSLFLTVKHPNVKASTNTDSCSALIRKALCASIASPERSYLGGGVARLAPGTFKGLRVFVPKDDRFRDMFTKIRLQYSDQYSLPNITLVDHQDSEEAHIQALMGTDTNAVTLKLLDCRVTKYGADRYFTQSLDTTNFAYVADVFSRISHYYHELNSTHSTDPDIAEDITLEFYKLDDHHASDWRQFRPDGPNLYQNGVVDFEVDEGAPYGLKLINRSARDLYPYVFYFNTNNLSIGALLRALFYFCDRLTSCSSLAV